MSRPHRWVARLWTVLGLLGLLLLAAVAVACGAQFS